MNYPTGIKKEHKQTINYSHRGMTLEDDINHSNNYYREKDIAYIYKKPTPIKVTKVDFRKDRTSTIKEAFYQEPSTTDYNGIYKGKYIDFEAKETKQKTSFPRSINLPPIPWRLAWPQAFLPFQGPCLSCLPRPALSFGSPWPINLPRAFVNWRPNEY